MAVPVFVVILIVVFYLLSSIKILAEYERGVIFRLGRLLPEAKGPGVIFVFAPLDRIVRVPLRIDTIEVPPQDVVTRDNVSVKVNAVIYFRVVEPRLAVVEVTELSECHFATRANHLTQRARRSGTRRPAEQARSSQCAPSVSARPAHLAVGCESHHGGGEAGGSRGADDPRAGQTGRSGTGAPCQNHPRRRRIHGGGKIGHGGGSSAEAAGGDPAPLSADAGGNRRGEEHHGDFSRAYRYPERDREFSDRSRREEAEKT